MSAFSPTAALSELGTAPPADGPAEGSAPPRRHLVSLLVENKAGVLVRIAGLFSRRGFNIFSLAVAPTQDPRFSRVSVVVDLESTRLDQVVSQLEKLINVVALAELRPEDAEEAELLLATVSSGSDQRGALLEVLQTFEGRLVAEAGGTYTVLLAGHPSSLDAFETALTPYGIVALQRTGTIALPKLAAAT